MHRLVTWLAAPLVLGLGTPDFQEPEGSEAPPDAAGESEVAARAGKSGDAGEAPRPLSMLVRPVHLQEEIPETRALRHVLLQHRDVPGVSRQVTRSREEALEIARELHQELEAGADFGELIEEHSESPVRRRGGVLGSFARGTLEPRLDEFLFSAETGEYSEPISTAGGVLIAQRIDAHAGALQIEISGRGPESRRRALELLERVRAGEDFGELAREHSDDPVSAERGGRLAIFERGPFDTLIKEAAFQAGEGEVVGPIASPRGYHLVKRVPPEDLPSELRDPVWIRARAIVLAYGGAPDFPHWVERTEAETEDLARELHARIAEGADMAALAREYDDDPAGRERSGDLGWIHRRTPHMAPILERLFLSPAGTLFDPIRIPQGWVLLRRER